MVAIATGALTEVIGDLQRAAGATERLMELLHEKPQIHAPLDPLPLPARLGGLDHPERVAFRLPLESRSAGHRRYQPRGSSRLQRGVGG